MIPQFIEKWESGFKIVMGQKLTSEESKFMYNIRKLFYWTLRSLSDDNTQQLSQCTGFGLYDKQVMDVLRKIEDPYPYFRGLLCEVGFEKALIPYNQPLRKSGITKNNFYTLYDMAMLAIVKHSKLPLRLVTILGFSTAILSLIFAIFYCIQINLLGFIFFRDGAFGNRTFLLLISAVICNRAGRRIRRSHIYKS